MGRLQKLIYISDCIEHLLPIINEYKGECDLPLDTDEVNDLARVLREMINYIEGNIDRDEYHQLIDLTTRTPVAEPEEL